MDLKGRTARTLQPLGLSLAEHYVMCAAGYRVTLPPDEFVQFAVAAFEHDPRGPASLEELTTALARLEAREFMTRLTADTLGQEVDRSATGATPEVMEFYRVGDVDFTPRGYAVYRDVIRSIHGDDFLTRADTGFNVDPDAGRVDVYAATVDDCRSLMGEIETSGDSFTGAEQTRFTGRKDPTPMGRWRPNRFAVREAGYHGVLHFSARRSTPAQARRRRDGNHGGRRMPRRLRYHVAVSLDGFIAGPNGEFDWIVMDPAIDFGALYSEFDTAIMGRKTYEVMTTQGGNGAIPGLDVVVFSRTLPAATHRGIRIVSDDPREVVAALKKEPGRDIWLFGGGELFRTLLDAGLVDTVEPAVIPVLLGTGIPLMPPGARTKLILADQKVLPKSGILALAYSVPGGVGPAPRVRYVKPNKSRVKNRAVAGKGGKRVKPKATAKRKEKKRAAR